MWQGHTVLRAAVESNEPRMIKEVLDRLQDQSGDEDGVSEEVRLQA